MDHPRASRRCGRALAVGAIAVLVGALGATDALAATKKKAKHPVATPPYYTLKNTKQRCRANYTRQRITISVRKGHRKVTLHQVRCVYTGRGPSGATVAFPTSLPTAAITVTVIPSAGDESFTIAANKTLQVGGAGVLTGQTGVSAELVTGAGHGSVTLSRNGTFRYVPSGTYSGLDSFKYKVVSSSGESSTPATVTIHVTPVAVAVGTYDVPLSGTLSVSAPGVLTGDIGTGLTARLVSDPSGGQLTLNPDGSFTYMVIPPFSGADSFSFEAVDAAGQVTATVTVNVAVGDGPPLVSSETFNGEIGNTELQVGGSRGSGPELWQPSASALANDLDSGGGTLTTTPATITTAQGGQVIMAGDGSFSYQPPVGLSNASDSFDYQVDSPDGLSAIATATINFANARVWYVNSAAPPGGNGTSASPFNSLSSVNTPGGAAASGDEIFLFASASAYSGGAVLGPGQTLVGEPYGLSVNNEQLLAASNVAAPQITSGGVGVTLANNDTVEGVAITNPTGDGIHMGDGSFSVNDVTITGAGADGIDVQSPGTGSSGYYIANSQISGAHGTAILLSYAGTASGGIIANTIGSGSTQTATWTAASGSTTGDGIDISSSGAAAAVFANVYGNNVFGIAAGTGMRDTTSGGGALQLVLSNNFVATDTGDANKNAVTLTAGSDGNSGTVCVDPAQDTLKASGSSSYGIAVTADGAGTSLGLQGFSGSTTGDVVNFLSGLLTLPTGDVDATATAGGTFVGCTVEQPTS